MFDGTQMIAEGEIRGFPWLGHEVGDVGPRSFGVRDRVSNFWNEQIGNHAGVKRTGAHEDDVGLLYGFDRGGERTNAAGIQRNFTNGNLAVRDARFALHSFAIGKSSDQVHIRKRGREDAAAHSEDFAGDANGLSEVPGDMRERRQEEVAEIVAAQATADMKTILKEAAQQRFILRKCHHAIADVAWRKYAIFPAEASGAAAVVGDRDDGSKVSDRPFERRMLIAAANDVFFQTAEQCGKTGASSQRDNAQAILGKACL